MVTQMPDFQKNFKTNQTFNTVIHQLQVDLMFVL